MMRLFLDDTNRPPRGWVRCESINEAITMLQSCRDVEEISLDHNLGKNNRYGRPYDLLVWMAKNDMWPPMLTIHSRNVRGRDEMIAVLRKHSPYKHRKGSTFVK